MCLTKPEDLSRVYVYLLKSEKNKKLFEIPGNKKSDEKTALKVVAAINYCKPYQTEYLPEGVLWEIIK